MCQMEIQMPGEGTVLGSYPAHSEALAFCCCLQQTANQHAAEGNIKSSITVRRAMRPFVKILCPLVSVSDQVVAFKSLYMSHGKLNA